MQTILSINTPPFLYYADKPLKKGGKIQKLEIKDFEKKIGMIYSEHITKPGDLAVSNIQSYVYGSASEGKLKSQIKDYIEKGPQNLMLCEMEKVGLGVFATKTILKDTLVSIYSGTIQEGMITNDCHDEAMHYFGTNYSINTSSHRCLATFMQHLPLNPEADRETFLNSILKGKDYVAQLYSSLCAEFDPSVKDKIAFANVRQEFVCYGGIPVIAMVADCTIQVGDQLGYSYGQQYWFSRNITPEFFDKEGMIIPHRLYKRTYGDLRLSEEFIFTGDYNVLTNLLKNPREIISIPVVNSLPHEMMAVDLAALLVGINACTLSINVPDFNFEKYQWFQLDQIIDKSLEVD